MAAAHKPAPAKYRAPFLHEPMTHGQMMGKIHEALIYGPAESSTGADASAASDTGADASAASSKGADAPRGKKRTVRPYTGEADTWPDDRSLNEYAGRKVIQQTCIYERCKLHREDLMCEYCALHCPDIDC